MKAFMQPPVVIVRHPGNTDTQLAAAWRLISDEDLAAEIDDEIRSIAYWSAVRPIDHNRISAKKVRLHKMRRVQTIRAERETFR